MDMTTDPARPLSSLLLNPAHAGKAAPFLPMSRAEMMALGWDADMNRPDRLVDEAMDLGGCLMTECGPRPSPQYGGP